MREPAAGGASSSGLQTWCAAARFGARGLIALLAACALLHAFGCAAEKPRPPAARAPDAKTPTFGALMHTTARPTHEGGALVYGDVKEAKHCAVDPSVTELPSGGAILLRFNAPVPTDLGMFLDTSAGPSRIVKPESRDDEERLAAAGRPYYYENEAILRAAATGAIAPREVAVWPGARRGDRSLSLAVWDISFDPQASGADLQSAPMRVAAVGRCPDFSITTGREALQLKPGEGRRLHASVVPSGDGIGTTMALELSLTGAPAGVKATVKDAQLSSADWINPRDAAFEIDVLPAALPATAPIVLHVKLGAIEHTASLALTVLPKDDL